MSSTPPPNRKGRPRGSGSFPWRGFFQQSTTPVFVLGKGRRLRYANPAWERLTGLKLADALGMVFSARRHSTPLAAALAPSPEAEAGKPDRVRRHAPTGRTGPPWWDIDFEPLAGAEGQLGIVGFISVIGEAIPTTVRKMPPAIAALRMEHAGSFSLDLFAGQSPAVQRFRAQLLHSAGSNAPVWILGDPGTGKEAAARAIHHASAQRNKAFVGLSCAGLQPYLLESLLFGLGGLMGTGLTGTVYLKEPAGLPRDLQQRLAELFVDAKPETPRLICGSSHPALQDVAAGKLLPDFHTDLSVIEFRVPPLRERLADLPRLAARLMPGAKIDADVYEVLGALPWPGNLRELAEVLGAARAAAGDKIIRKEHLPHALRVQAGLDPSPPNAKTVSLDALLEAVERRMIAAAMAKTNGNTTKAAELLGIFRARLSRRLEALGMNGGGEG